MSIILNTMKQKKGSKGYLIDGFPVNLEEAQAVISN
jgi:adenylate kinase family enzyme